MKRLFAIVLVVLAFSGAAAWAAVPTPKCPPYAGLRKRIAVLPITVTARAAMTRTSSGEASSTTWATDQAPGQVGAALTEQLTTALIDTGHFIVLERAALQEVLGEQDLGANGRVNHETAAPIGKMTGAEWLIKAAITEYTDRKSSSGGSLLLRNLGIGEKKKEAYVALDLRIIDAATGQVVDSVKADGRSHSGGIQAGFAAAGVALNGHKEDTTPIGQATRAALVEAVDFICQRMEQVPWQSRVMDVENDEVTITGGSNMNMPVGCTFTVFHRGKALVDPDTGETLGYRETEIGTLEVSQVLDRFSVGKMIAGGPPQRGDVVRGNVPLVVKTH